MKKKRVKNKDEVKAHPESKARQARYDKETLTIATCIGMLALLAGTIIFVGWRAPLSPFGADTVPVWLKFHQGMNYFIKAKALVKPLVSAPVEKWSLQYQDPDSDCVEVGNGVWEAVGTVDTTGSGLVPVHQHWTVYFWGDTLTPLYCKVGDVESGNLVRALGMAHAKSSL